MFGLPAAVRMNPYVLKRCFVLSKGAAAAIGVKTFSSAFISPNEFRDFTLREITDYNHDTKHFRINLPEPDQPLGIKTAFCVIVKGSSSHTDEATYRPYTPTSTNNDKGYFDLLIKKYPTGAVSSHMHSLKPGDSVLVKGPFMKLDYEANMYKRIGMIAGGTGIAPMLQVIETIMQNPDDHTKVSLIFANKTVEDILLKERLDELAKCTTGRLSVHYTVDSLPTGEGQSMSPYRQGYITREMAGDCLPPPPSSPSSPQNHGDSGDSVSGGGVGTVVMVCGPPPMMEAVCGNKGPNKTQGELKGLLKDMGYTAENVFKF